MHCTVGVWALWSPAQAASGGWCFRRGVWYCRGGSRWTAGSGTCVESGRPHDPVVGSTAAKWCWPGVTAAQTPTRPCCSTRLKAWIFIDGAQAWLSFGGLPRWASTPFAMNIGVENPPCTSNESCAEPVFDTPEQQQLNGCLDTVLALHRSQVVGYPGWQLGYEVNCL